MKDIKIERDNYLINIELVDNFIKTFNKTVTENNIAEQITKVLIILKNNPILSIKEVLEISKTKNIEKADYLLNIELVNDFIKDVSKYNMVIETITEALIILKNNPILSIEEVLELAYNDWIK